MRPRQRLIAGMTFAVIGALILVAGMSGVVKAVRAKPIARAPFPVKTCINMGNALEAPVEGNWGYRIEGRHFGVIKNAGFDTVRIPIKWSAHASNSQPYAVDPKFFARVDDVVSQAIAINLNVIINVHHYDELYADPDTHERRVTAIWDQIAARYQSRSPRLMFEIINEPRDAFSGARVNRTQDAILARIRTTNPTRTVILAGDQYGGLDGLFNLKVPDDSNVVATVHYYTPYEFTHQGASWLPNPPPPGRSWPQPGETAQLQRDVARMVAWRARNQVPLLLGEFGTDAAVPEIGRAEWSRDVRLALNSAGIPWCAYNFAGGFPLYDVAAERWNTPLLEALGMYGAGLRQRR